MIYFNCDYTEGAHPRILQRLIDTNLTQSIGYSEDEYCKEAAKLIRFECHSPKAAVHFLVGGTQTNTIVISSLLKPYEGVLCAQTGHINVHETGAVEATGHKVLPLPTENGKFTAASVEAAVLAHQNDPAFEHIVKPAMVYLSQPTELGTLYSLSELTAISDVCRRYHLPLFLDGARLSYGLASFQNDVSLPDIARLCDVFYIGGTKVGLLFGEAVVFPDPSLSENFRYMIKQRGAMLAKGRLLGLQFAEAFTDGLYYEMGKHAVDLAMKIRSAFIEAGYELYADSPTNQQFFILPLAKYNELSEHFVLETTALLPKDRIAVRICTSWATREENVDRLLSLLH